MNLLYTEYVLSEERRRLEQAERKREPWHADWERPRRERRHVRLHLAALRLHLQRLVRPRLARRKATARVETAR